MHSKSKKIISQILLSGMILMTAVFSIPPGLAQAEPVPIIFATNSNLQDLPFNLSNAKLLFQGDDLTPTYSISGDSQLLASMRANSRISFAEPDVKISAAILKTNDPYFPTDTLNVDAQWYLKTIKIPDAWIYGTGSRDVKVAIIDTGIHASHIELNDGRVIAGYNVVDDVPIGSNTNSDDNGHGTAVAGIIGAISNNGKGIAGINWDVSLMPVKALSADGSGNASDLAQAIVWAADNGANIINLSLGGPGFGADQALNSAISHAYGKGVLIISAAGNDLADQGLNLDTTPVYPICSDNGKNMVIGVAASDINDQKASFSNFGISCVDITAPGKRILTTAYLPSDPSNNILIYASGTSLATPIVTGVAALLKASNPSLTQDDMRNILLKSADNIDELNPTQCLGTSCAGFLGKGRVNAFSALSPKPILDGSVTKDSATGSLYLIEGGKKRPISNFVFQQRGFTEGQVVVQTDGQLNSVPLGNPLMPYEGTLVKSPDSPTVYIINQDLKRPLTFLVFQSRGYNFSDVKTIPTADLTAMPTGEWYWPPDGTMVVVKGNPTIYVMDDGVKRPVTYFVFIQRKLSFSRVVNVTQDEFGHIPNAPDIYWLAPLNGTLVKSLNSNEVYYISDSAKHAVSYDVFVARKFSFANIKTLPQAEVDVILPGSPLTN